jgi:hypothetical protein
MLKLWARYMPRVSIFGVSLNPGPFTIKEHVITAIMANVGASPAYAVSAAQAVSPYLFLHLLYLDRDHRRPKGFLQSESQLWLSVLILYLLPLFDRFLAQIQISGC